MSGDSSVVVTGLKDVQRMLTKMIPRHAERIQREMVHAVTKEVAKESKKRARAIKSSGVLAKAFYAKKQRSPADNPVSILRVRRGGKSKPDGFYWRFLEYGTGGKRIIKPSRKNRFKGRKRTVNVKPVAPRHIVRESRSVVYTRFPQLLPKLFVRELQKEIRREAKRS